MLDRLNPSSDNFILSGVSSALSSIFSTLGNILSYLNPFSENFFVYKLIELLGDLLKALFIPSEERLTAIGDTVKSKFGFIDTIKDTINTMHNLITNLDEGVEMSYNVESKYYTGAVPIVNLSWYRPFKPYGDIVITGFVYMFFIWRIFIHAPNIIHGLGGDYVEVSTISERRGKSDN